MSLYENIKLNMDEMVLGDHICSFYKSKEELFSIVIPFLKAGLERNEKCVYVIDENTEEDIIEALNPLIDLDQYIRAKQLVFLTSEETYLKDETFVPEEMIDFIKEKEKEALEYKHAGLRIAVENTWILSRMDQLDKVLEYDALLNYYFPTSKCLALCQFNEERFSPELLLDILYLHPKILIGDRFMINPLFISSEEFLERKNGTVSQETYNNIKDDLIHKFDLFNELKKAQNSVMVSHRFLEISNIHSNLDSLLNNFVEDIKNFSGCESVGIRIIDEEENLPYRANIGFSENFLKLEGTLSLEQGTGLCVGIFTGKVDHKSEYLTDWGSFCTNNLDKYSSLGSDKAIKDTHDTCFELGYNSLAIIPIYFGEERVGLIHIADHKKNMINQDLVYQMEIVAKHIYQAIKRVEAEEALKLAHEGLEEKIRYRTESLLEVNKNLEMEIADRKVAEIETKEREKRLSAIVDNSPSGIILVGLDQQIIDANKSCERLLGYTYTEFRNMTIMDITHEEDRAATEELAESLMNGEEETIRLEKRYLTKNGDIIHGRIVARIVKNEENAPLYFICQIEDLTDLKMTQQSLERSLSRIQSAKKIAKMGEFEHNYKTGEFHLPQELFEEYGLKEEEIDFSYDTLLNFIHADDKKRIEKAIEDSLKKMIPIREEYRITIPIVGERFIYQHSEVIFDDEGKPEKMVGIIQDITDSKILEESIVVSQEKYSSIFGKMKEGFAHYKIIYDELGEPVDFMILEMNDSYLEQTGLTRDLVIGSLFSEVMFDPKEDLKRLNSLKKIAQGGKSVEFEEFTKELNKWFLIIVFYTQKDHVATLSIDITERKEIERELTERDRLTKTSKEIALISEFEYTLATDEFHFSEEFYEIFGFSRYDIQKPLDDLFDLIHPEDREFVRKRYQLIIGGKPSKAYRFRIQLSDGSIKHVLQKAEVIFDENNKPEKIIGIIQNVTEQEELDLQFLQSEEQFREVMENAPVGVVITNLERELLRYNTKFVQLVGYETKEDFAENFISVENFYLNPKERERLYKILNENGIVEKFDTIFKRRDDTTFWCSLTSKVHETISGEVLVYHIIEDISTLKEGEHALGERIKEITSLYSLSKILRDTSKSYDEIFNDILKIIPLAWQYSEITTARIFYNDEEFKLTNFQKTKWVQTSDIVVSGEVEGTIEVFYLEEKSQLDEGPFLKEERDLINNFALEIGSFFEQKKAEEERKVSEEKFRSIFNFSNDGYLLNDPDGTILDINPTLLEKFGYERDEIIGKNLENFDYVVETESDKLFAETITEQGFSYLETYLKKKDGSIIPVDLFSRRIDIADKEVIFTVVRDLTQRKEAEEALIESEEKYHSLFDKANDIILLLSPAKGTEKSYILESNEKATEILGYTKEEFQTMTTTDIEIDEEVWKKGIFNIRKQMDTKGFTIFERTLKCKNGNFIQAEISSHVITLKDESLHLAIIRDITVRKEAEENLKMSEIRWTSLVENSPDFISIISPDGTIQAVNRVLPHLTEEDVIATSVFDNMRPEKKDEFQKLFNQVFTKGKTKTIVYDRLGGDNSIFWYETRIVPITEADKVVAALTIASDITERKEAEKIIKSSEEKFRSVFNHSNDGYILRDIDGNIIDINPKLLDILGYTPEDLEDKTLIDFDYIVNHDNISELNEMIQEEGYGYIETEFKRKDNILIQTNVYATKFELAGREVVLAVIRDITEQKKAEEDKLVSEARYRELINIMSSGVAVYEAIDEGNDFIFKDFNPAGERIDNRTKESVLGKRLTKTFPGFEEYGFLDVFRRVWKTGKPETYPATFYEDDKIAGWRENYVYKLPSGEIVAVYDDVTEKRIAEENLQRERDTAQKYFETVGVMMLVLNKEGTVLQINDRGCEILGYEKNQIIGKNWFENFIPKRLGVEFKDVHNRNIEIDLEDVIYYENPVLTSKNKERHIIWRNTSLRNEKGEVVGVLSSGEDITERKMAETEITKSEEQLRNLMENVPAGIAITDEEAKLIEYNPAFRNILGYISDEDFEKADVMNTKLGESERDKMFKLIELEGSIRSFETKLTKKDGSQIWGSFSSVKQTLPTGDIHYIHILQDITERKEEEIRLIRQIMRFDLKEGELYLTLEEYPGTAIEAFKDLQKVGYEGTIISRTPLKEWEDVFDEYVEAYWLSEKMDQQSIMPVFSELEKFIIKLPRRKVLLLDRLEYLIESNDFNSTLRFVYRLKELANMLDLTIIISLDPGTMDSRERTLLEKETNQIERRIHSRISEDLLEVLKYINNENILGNKPSYTDVGKELSISRPTTRQRLQKLIESGFIKETTSGRMKVLEVTQKGRLAL